MGFSHDMSPRVEISKRLLAINSASGALARIINVSVLVWLNQYLLRRISAEEFALYPLLTGVILLMPLLTNVLTAGLGRYVMEAYAKGNDRGVTQIVSTMFPILTLASLLLLAGGGLFAWQIDKVLTIPPDRLWDARVMMTLLVVSVSLRVMFSPFGVGIYVRQKYILFNMMNVSNQLFRALLLFLLLYGVSARVLWVVVANVVAEITLLAGTRIVSMRMVPALRFDVRAIQWHYARELISFGGWTLLGSMAHHLRETAFPLILNKLATNTDVSLTYIGFMAKRQIDMWVGTMMTPLYPMVTGMHAIGAYARVRSAYTRGGRLALWMILLPALPAIIYSQTIIRLYIGNQYAEAGVVMAFTLASFVITAGGHMLWPVANAAGRVRLAGATALGTQVATVALAIYMVTELKWGATGVGVASFLIPSIVGVAVNWPLGQRLAKITFGDYVRLTLLPGLTPGCVASVVWVLLSVLFRPGSWVGLGVCTLAGAVCYGAVLLGFCLEPQDKQDLMKVKDHVYRRVSGAKAA